MCKAVSLRCLIILAFLLTSLFATARDVAAKDQEYPLKASFLCIFGDLVRWNNEPGLGDTSTLSIGILGRDPFGAVLTDGRRLNHLDQQVAKKVRVGKKFNIRRFATLDESQPCHMLFIADDVARDAQALRAVLEATRGQQVLLVGDTPGLAEQGVTINMVVDAVRNRVQLEINPDAAQRAGLVVDQRLYRLPGVKIVRQ